MNFNKARQQFGLLKNLLGPAEGRAEGSRANPVPQQCAHAQGGRALRFFLFPLQLHQVFSGSNPCPVTLTHCAVDVPVSTTRWCNISVSWIREREREGGFSLNAIFLLFFFPCL